MNSKSKSNTYSLILSITIPVGLFLIFLYYFTYQTPPIASIKYKHREHELRFLLIELNNCDSIDLFFQDTVGSFPMDKHAIYFNLNDKNNYRTNMCKINVKRDKKISIDLIGVYDSRIGYSGLKTLESIDKETMQLYKVRFENIFRSQISEINR